MADARLILLGPPTLEVSSARPPLTSSKGLALLAYLALSAHPRPRLTAADLLWPGRPRTEALTNLRRTLYRVRSALPPSALDTSGGRLSLSGRDLWVDAWAFRDALRALRPGAEASPAALRALDAAVTLYGGALLEGLELPGCAAFEEWLSLEREAHRHALAGALEHLGEASLAAGDGHAALRTGSRWAALQPFNEAAHRLVMRAHAALGDGGAALEHYRRCRAILRRELGALPSAATDALYRTLRSSTQATGQPRRLPSPEVRYVRSGDVHIAYQVVGRGAFDLIVAPGFVSHLDHLWRHPPLRAALSRLAERCRLILFDRRGVGLSERIGAPPTIDATARDIDAVLGAVGSSRAFLFGFSEGGSASLLYAALHPHRVRGLVLYGTMARGLHAPDYPWAPDARQFDAWLEALVSRWGRPVPHEAFAPSHRHDAALWSWYAEMMRLASSPAGMRSILDAVRRLDTRPLLRHVTVPVLLLHRRRDRVIRVGAGRYLAAHLPAARYLELDGEDHWWWLGENEALMGAVEGFVTEAPGRAPAPPLHTVVCHQRGRGSPDVRAFPDPLAALEAVTDPGAAGRRGERAVVHCGATETDAKAATRRLLVGASPGDVLATERVRDIACSVGYAFEPRGTAPAVARDATPLTWVLTRRPG